MKFVNFITYVPDTEKIESVRPAHREYAHKLHADGKIVIAGPFDDGAGALIIYEAHDLNAAEALAANDPYARGGVWSNYEIHPWTILGGNLALLPPQVS